jgi:transposase
MEVLWLISQGETHARCGQLAGVSKATVARYIAIFRQHGVAGLRAFHWAKPISALETHRRTLEAEFRERPPHTIAEAAERIETLTGVRRKETQVRMFLKKVSA